MEPPGLPRSPADGFKTQMLGPEMGQLYRRERVGDGIVAGAPGFLPAGFHLSSSDPMDITSQDVTYSTMSPTDPPRAMVGYDVFRGPLVWTVGGRAVARTLVIQSLPRS